jgi:hypothetical protein
MIKNLANKAITYLRGFTETKAPKEIDLTIDEINTIAKQSEQVRKDYYQFKKDRKHLTYAERKELGIIKK